MFKHLLSQTFLSPWGQQRRGWTLFFLCLSMFLLLQFMTMPPILLSATCCLFLRYPGYTDEHQQAPLSADTLHPKAAVQLVQEVQAQTQELLAGWGHVTGCSLQGMRSYASPADHGPLSQLDEDLRWGHFIPCYWLQGHVYPL